MPNFSYTASKAWTPYTFEEMLKPLAMYTEEYNKQEDALADISTKAEMLRRQAQEAGGKVADVYNSYANELDEQATLLTKYGLSPSTRASIKNLQKQYASNIVPIEDAIKYKKAIADEQRKLRAQDSSIMFDRDYSTVNLNDIYDNPELGYQAISGNDLYKQGVAAAKAASMRNINIGTALGGQYFAIKQGYGDKAAQQFLLNNESIPELHDAIGRIVKQSGVTDENKNRAIDYIINGMMSGLVYDEKYQANRGYETPSERTSREYHEALLDERKKDRMAKLYGAEMPNGDYVKDIGGGRIRVTHPNGTTEIISGNKAEGLRKQLDLAATVKDKPVIVAYTNGQWRIGEEEKDVPKTAWGMTRSNAVSTWGDYTLDNVSSDNIVTDYSEIPTEALDKILKAFKDYNLSEDDYYIVRVKAESSRAAGDYDYVLMPSSKLFPQSVQNDVKKSNSTQTSVPYRLPESNTNQVRPDTITSVNPSSFL